MLVVALLFFQATASITDGRVLAKHEKMAEKIKALEMEKFKVEQKLQATQTELEKAQAEVAAKVGWCFATLH